MINLIFYSESWYYFHEYIALFLRYPEKIFIHKKDRIYSWIKGGFSSLFQEKIGYKSGSRFKIHLKSDLVLFRVTSTKTYNPG